MLGLCAWPVYWACVLGPCAWPCVLGLCIGPVCLACVMGLCIGPVYWPCVLGLCIGPVCLACVLGLCAAAASHYYFSCFSTSNIESCCILNIDRGRGRHKAHCRVAVAAALISFSHSSVSLYTTLCVSLCVYTSTFLTTCYIHFLNVILSGIVLSNSNIIVAETSASVHPTTKV